MGLVEQWKWIQGLVVLFQLSLSGCAVPPILYFRNIHLSPSESQDALPVHYVMICAMFGILLALLLFLLSFHSADSAIAKGDFNEKSTKGMNRLLFATTFGNAIFVIGDFAVAIISSFWIYYYPAYHVFLPCLILGYTSAIAAGIMFNISLIKTNRYKGRWDELYKQNLELLQQELDNINIRN